MSYDRIDFFSAMKLFGRRSNFGFQQSDSEPLCFSPQNQLHMYSGEFFFLGDIRNILQFFMVKPHKKFKSY